MHYKILIIYKIYMFFVKEKQTIPISFFLPKNIFNTWTIFWKRKYPWRLSKITDLDAMQTREKLMQFFGEFRSRACVHKALLRYGGVPIRMVWSATQKYA